MARSMARSAEAQTNSFRTGGCPGTSQMRVCIMRAACQPWRGPDVHTQLTM